MTPSEPEVRIHCLCIAKDEEDILGEVIQDAANWADNIFIADNGSEDRTVDVIHEMELRFSQVTFLGILDEPFTNEIRGKMFNMVKNVSQLGDWWCRLDADEIYIDNPRRFLGELPGHADIVMSSHFNFYFTERDIEKYNEDPEYFLSLPVVERLRYYHNNWSENRFVKHTRSFDWSPRDRWPRNLYCRARHRIRVGNYQYRSPGQIMKRLKVRRKAINETGGKVFVHEMTKAQRACFHGKPVRDPSVEALHDEQVVDFRERVWNSSDFDFWDQGDLVSRPNLLPTYVVKPRFFPALLWKAAIRLKRKVSRVFRTVSEDN
ncbi:MAG: glycosyltransferase family 2 protein [Thermodesulfobacteriota bacterium]|nr:glycosyltransferase family 2 protein [Thermodesulfobacteriota bacterium]